jgi:hypothetical protein
MRPQAIRANAWVPDLGIGGEPPAAHSLDRLTAGAADFTPRDRPHWTRVIDARCPKVPAKLRTFHHAGCLASSIQRKLSPRQAKGRRLKGSASQRSERISRLAIARIGCEEGICGQLPPGRWDRNRLGLARLPVRDARLRHRGGSGEKVRRLAEQRTARRSQGLDRHRVGQGLAGGVAGGGGLDLEGADVDDAVDNARVTGAALVPRRFT